MRSLLFVLAAVAAASPVTVMSASAQEERRRPSEVEAALRRRVDSWLRDRGQSDLACRMCECVAERVADCRDCDMTGVNRRKIGAALWSYLPPSFRRTEVKERWTRQFLRTGRGAWSNGNPYAARGLVVTRVSLSREVAWVYYAPDGDNSRGWASQWIREGDAYFLCETVVAGSRDKMVDHGWFTPDVSSVGRVCFEIERLDASLLEPNLTDLERARRQEARGNCERELRKRVVADFGRVFNVERVDQPPGARRRCRLKALVDRAQVFVDLQPAPSESDEAFESRLASFSAGSTVFLRGRVVTWTIEDGWVQVLELTDAEVAHGD